MKNRLIFEGFSLEINIPLLAIAIVSIVVYSFSYNETIRNICIATGWILILLAIGPSSFRTMWEELKKGKPLEVDCNVLVPELHYLRLQMGITKYIHVRIIPKWNNAQARFSTINIGQPLLTGTLDNTSIKGLLAHELAHIKGNHTLKTVPLFFTMLFAEAVLLLFLTYFTPFGYSLFPFLALSIAFASIATRFMTWPFEYRADLVAKQYAGREAIVSCLKAVATIRKVDIRQDFYFHPSTAKRIANLCWIQQKRFRKWYKWYIEL